MKFGYSISDIQGGSVQIKNVTLQKSCSDDRHMIDCITCDYERECEKKMKEIAETMMEKETKMRR